MKDIVKLYATGLSCKDVAKAVGSSEESVRRRLRDLGVERRPKSFKRPKPIPSWDAYFNGKVKKSGDCLLWTGFCDGAGYGRLVAAFAPGVTFAHRMSWFLSRGPFDQSLRILHKCDVPTCVRPDHLWIGTQIDNIADMKRKGRQRSPGFKGEKHPQARLSNDDVIAMRDMRRTKKISYHKLAAIFGVTPMTAHRACTGGSWTHI